MMEEEEEETLFDQEGLLGRRDEALSEKKEWKRKLLKTATLSMSFFCLGLCIAIPGPTLLDLGKRVNRSIEHMTFIFTARSGGYLVGSLAGGVLFDCFDQQILLFYTISAVAVATASIPWCTALMALSVFVCVQGIALGVLDTGGNIFCIKIWGQKSAPFMQALHFAFGIGAFLAPLMARPFLMDPVVLSNNITKVDYYPVNFKLPSLDSVSGHGRFVRSFYHSSDWEMYYTFEHIPKHGFLTLKHLHGNFNRGMPDEHNLTNSVMLDVSSQQFSKKIHSRANDVNEMFVNAVIPQLEAVKNEPSFLQEYLAIKQRSRHHDVSRQDVEVFSRYRRDESRLLNATNDTATEIISPLFDMSGSTNVTVSVTQTPTTTTVGVKKPEHNDGRHLSETLADSEKINQILKDIIHKPPSGNSILADSTAAGGSTKDAVSDKISSLSNTTVSSLDNGSFSGSNSTHVFEETTATLPTTASAAVTGTTTAASASTVSTTTASRTTVSITTTPLTTTSTTTTPPTTASTTTASSTMTPLTTASITSAGTTTTPLTTASTTSAGTTTTPLTTASTTSAGTTTTPLTIASKTTSATTTTHLTTSATTVASATMLTSLAIVSTSTNVPTSDITPDVTTNPAFESATKPVEAVDDLSTGNTSSSRNVSGRSEDDGDIFSNVFAAVMGMSKIQVAYSLIGMLLAVNSGLFLFLYCKDRKQMIPVTTRSHEDLTRPPDTRCFISSLIILLFLFFFTYVGMEVTFGGLLTTFAVYYPLDSWTPASAAVLTALFWGCLALGRCVAIFIARCFKPPCMMVTNLCLTVAGAVILCFVVRVGSTMLWLGTVTLGLGMSSLFPTAISWANSYYPLTGKSTAIFVAGSGVGEMVIPVMTGFLFEKVDQMSLMYVTLALSILMSVIYLSLQLVVCHRGKAATRRSHSGFMRLNNLEDMSDAVDMDTIESAEGGIPDASETTTRVRKPDRGNDGVNGIRKKPVDDTFTTTEFTRLVELSD